MDVSAVSDDALSVRHVEVAGHLVHAQHAADLAALARRRFVERTDGLALALLRLHDVAQAPAFFVVCSLQLTTRGAAPIIGILHYIHIHVNSKFNIY